MIETKFIHTDIGLVPEDWTLLSIKEDVSVHARIGWQGLTTNEYLDHGLYRLVTSTDIENGGVNWDTCHYVSEWRYRQDDKIILEEGDTLLSKDGTIGKVAFVKNIPSPSTLNSGVYVLRPKDENKLTKGYLALCFKSMFFKDFMDRLSAGSTINHLYQKDIIGFTFPVPNKEEQQRIASALMKVDALISNLDKLIAKKQAIKKGAMQELLTGKKRLPGFKGDWKEEKLGNVCNLFGRIGFRGYTKADLVEKGHGAITFSPSDIHNFKLSLEDCDYISFAKYEESPEIKVYNGDILFCKTASIGKCALVKGLEEKATINPQFVVLKDFKCDNHFLYYILIDTPFQTSVLSITGGSTIPTMSQEKLKSQELLFPPSIDEQRAIAHVLSTMDSDISLLQKKRKKYLQIKQGMMRDLLTGRIRLVDNDDMGKKLDGTRYDSYTVGLHKDPFDCAIAAEPHPD